MSTFIDRLLIKMTTNKMNKVLYSAWFNNGMPVSSGKNYTGDLIAGYLNNETIYSIVNRIARPASEVPLKVYTKDNVEIEDHWINKVLNQPNADTTINELIYNYYVYLLSIGNSYIYAPKMEDGRTIELWTAPSDLVEIVAGDWRNPIKGYKIMYGTQDVTPIAKKDMLHGKLFNPRFDDSGYWMYGLSPIQVAAQMIRQLNAGTERMAILAETGTPPFIISSTIPEGLTKTQQERLEDSYDEKYNGTSKTNKPLMSGTPLKVDSLDGGAADLELISGSQYATRVLCNVYGISSVLMNDLDNSTMNNVDSFRKDLYSDVIIPLNGQLEKKLKTFLAPTEDIILRFDYSKVEVLTDAIDSRMKVINDIAFLTNNEKRDMFGYDPIEEAQPKPTAVSQTDNKDKED